MIQILIKLSFAYKVYIYTREKKWGVVTQAIRACPQTELSTSLVDQNDPFLGKKNKSLKFNTERLRKDDVLMPR